jgi:O-antigen/teichoic acid export membrane protein
MGLASGTGVRLVAYAVGGVLSLAALPLLIRHLGLPDFGRYVAVLSIVGVAGLASDLGVTAIVLRDYTLASAERRADLLAGLLGARLAISALGAAAAVGFAVAAGYGGAAVLGTALACAGLLPQVYADMVVATLVVESRFAVAAAVDLARSLTATVLVVVLVIAGASLAWFLAAYAVAATAGALVARRTGAGQVALRPQLPSGDSRRVLAESLGFSLATAIHVVYFRAVMVVTSIRAPLIQGGWYAAAFRITEFLGAAAGQAAGTATPGLARASREPAEFRLSVRRVVVGSALLGAVVAGALALAAPLVVRVLGGRELEPAAGVLRIQAVAIGLMFVAFAAGAALFALRRHRDMALANVAGLVVAIVAALVLVPAHGARGAALAAVIAEAVLAACEAILLVRALPRRV